MTTRITQTQIVNNLQTLIDNQYSSLSTLQEQASTGKRILKPSDAPQDVGADLQARSALASISQYKANIQDGTGFMGATDTALGSVNTVLQRMRELAVEGSSDTLTSSERPFLNAEIEQLTRQLITIVDTQYKGDYIFGGTQTKVSPLDLKSSTCASAADYSKLSMAYFNAAGQTVPATVQMKNGFDGSPITNILPGTFSLAVGGTTYKENTDYTVNYSTGAITILNPALAVDTSPGTTNYASGQFAISFDYAQRGKDVYGQTVSTNGRITRQIDDGVSEPINISADQILQDPSNGSDMLATAISLGQDLLQNNITGIGNAITRIDAVAQTIHSVQDQNGARINLFQNALSRNQDENTNTTTTKSNLEDADMTKVLTDYSNAQNVFNASLKSGAMMIQESLVNFL